MSAEIDRFVTDLQKDAAFNAEVAARQDDVDGVIAIAAARGYKFSRADVEAYQAKQSLSDAQLDQVAGGRMASDAVGGGGGDYPWMPPRKHKHK